MPSKLRPEMRDDNSGTPAVTNGTAYMMILESVKAQDGLLHGRLDHGRAHCAIGSYFHINRLPLTYALVDEVAAVNDSVPHMTMRQRKVYVARWLRWKLAKLGMLGFKAAKPVQAGKV